MRIKYPENDFVHNFVQESIEKRVLEANRQVIFGPNFDLGSQLEVQVSKDATTFFHFDKRACTVRKDCNKSMYIPTKI
jgi:hypothetical protein